MTGRVRALVRGVALAVASGCGSGCEVLLTEPAPAEVGVSIRFQVAEVPVGGTAAAFSRVDRVGLRLARPGGQFRDTILAATPIDGSVRVAFALESDERVDGLGIAAQLGAGAAVLFQGATVVQVVPGEPTRAEVPLLPVPAALEADRDQFAFASIGATETFEAALLYATGDTIAGLVGFAGVWSSSDPAVAAIAPTGLAIAAGPGTALLEVRFDSLADTVRVTVPVTTPPAG